MSADSPPLVRSERVSGALASLRGLAVGDALGSQFFVPGNHSLLRRRELPPGTWQWTDDTEMACSVLAVLATHGRVDQDALAASFAAHHDFDRGYGPAVNRMLRLIRQENGDWRELSAGLFEGQGSWGNGAAMRVAPLGAWFADDPERAAEEAERSAEVTHRHPEAVAGTRAVAAAAALVAAGRRESAGPRGAAAGASGGAAAPDGARASDGAGTSGGARTPDGMRAPGGAQAPGGTQGPDAAQVSDGAQALGGAELLEAVLRLVPRSAVHAGLRRAADMLDYDDIATVAAVLGCGRRTSAQDTVPFTLWAVARHRDDFANAIWATAQAGGDVDTTCAIVGGIVAATPAPPPGGADIAPPPDWDERTEDFPEWLRERLA